jgi:hypothetical protein
MEICNTLLYERYCVSIKLKEKYFPVFSSFTFNLQNFWIYYFTFDACVTLRWGIPCLKIRQNLLLVFYAVEIDGRILLSDETKAEVKENILKAWADSGINL